MDNISQSYLPARPDLQKESVAFSAVKGVGMGAAVGAGLGALFKGINKLTKEPHFNGSILQAAVDVGVTVGLIDAFYTVATNRHKEATKPYVERLEQELVARDIAPGVNQQR